MASIASVGVAAGNLVQVLGEEGVIFLPVLEKNITEKMFFTTERCQNNPESLECEPMKVVQLVLYCVYSAALCAGTVITMYAVWKRVHPTKNNDGQRPAEIAPRIEPGPAGDALPINRPPPTPGLSPRERTIEWLERNKNLRKS